MFRLQNAILLYGTIDDFQLFKEPDLKVKSVAHATDAFDPVRHFSWCELLVRNLLIIISFYLIYQPLYYRNIIGILIGIFLYIKINQKLI